MDSFACRDELLFTYHALIEQHGWMVMFVIGDGRQRSWAYTIGLGEHHDHPELVTVGLDQESAHGIMRHLQARVAGGERLDELPGGFTSVAGVPVRLVNVHPRHWETDLFVAWIDYYASRGGDLPRVEALQLLWPDDDGRLLGDPDFDPRLRRLQTRLDRAPRRRQPSGRR